MTSYERVKRLLDHKRPDRIGLSESFWGDTHSKWVAGGKIKEGERLDDLFGFDFSCSGGVNCVIDLDFKAETVAEDEDTKTTKDGNGAIMRYHKKHSSVPEHIGFAITCKDDWERLAKPMLKFDKRRVDYEGYRNVKRECADKEKFFMWSTACVFEIMKDVAGHVHMLTGMALEPEWVFDMADTYIDLIICQAEDLFAKEGRPDGFFIYEDMGFKQRPFMSPAMFKELVLPAHKKLFDFCHGMGLKVMMHSCGFIEPLLPHLVDGGLDGLQAIEIKAGMDLLRIYREYGDRLSLMGGIDVRAVESNDRGQIDRELTAKIPIVKEGCAYFLHSDHSIPSSVEFETYSYFVEKGLALGTY